MLTLQCTFLSNYAYTTITSMRGMKKINPSHQQPSYPYIMPSPMYYPNHFVYSSPPINYLYDYSTFFHHSNHSGHYTHYKDYGQQPFTINIEKAAEANQSYRTSLWTGKNLQVTLMSLAPREDIGLEVHQDHDQFIRIEDGRGLVEMGNRNNHLTFQQEVHDDYAIMIPAGKWHNLTNIGHKPLKLYSIYAPPEHPFGTIHKTKEVAENDGDYPRH